MKPTLPKEQASPRRKGEQAKARLISAAAELMRVNDTVDVTLNEVATLSGLNSGLVKYHFGNKEGLLLALFERDILAGLKALQHLSNRSDLNPEEKLRAHLNGLLAAYRKAPYLNRLTQSLTRDVSEERLAKIGTEIIRPITDAQAKILREGYEAGLFRQVDPMSFYFASLCAAEGIYAQRFVLREGFGVLDLDDAVHRKNMTEVVDLLMNGVLRHKI